MAQAIKTPRAISDLESIVRYISRDNLQAAIRWLEDVEKLFDLVAQQPEIGQVVMTRRYGPHVATRRAII
jgi:plasmid stabilization system protein ParE